MKFLMLPIIFIVLFSLNSKGQTNDNPRVVTNDYPRFITDSPSGEKCVIFTIEQAKKLDSDEELLKIYQLLHLSSDSLINSLVFKVKVSDTEVAFLKLKITELEKVSATEKSLVSNLKDQIEDYKKNVALADKQLELKDEQLKNLDREIKRQKKLKIFGFSVGGLGIIVAILALL